MIRIRLMKKLKTFLVFLLIASFPLVSVANPTGRYAQLAKGESIPWAGWCFDSSAIAEIVAGKELEEEKCNLRVQKELEKQKADFDLQIGQLQATLDYQINTKQATIEALSLENTKLEETIISNTKYGWVTPLFIGVISGLAVGFFIGAYTDE